MKAMVLGILQLAFLLLLIALRTDSRLGAVEAALCSAEACLLLNPRVS